jgi:hypothetical protein
MGSKIPFFASVERFHEAPADRWREILAVDPGAIFTEPP